MSDPRAAVVLLGPPASGKTSVGRQLDAWPGVRVLQTGHLLRREAERGTARGKDVARALKEGRLASTESVTAILSDVVGETGEGILVFDGFPRSEEQLAPFSSLLRTARLDLSAVLVFMISDEEARHRLVGRRVCVNCGATYHVDYAPPHVSERCDACGGALVHRPDDQPEVIERRVAAYRQSTIPVIEYFEQRHRKATTRLEADGSPEQVFERVTMTLRTMMRMP